MVVRQAMQTMGRGTHNTEHTYALMLHVRFFSMFGRKMEGRISRLSYRHLQQHLISFITENNILYLLILVVYIQT